MRDKQWEKWYNRAIWRGPNGVRLMKLRRDPLCEVTGCHRPATAVDHRRAFRGDWFLFLGGTDLENLRSLCAPHHDAKQERFETGTEEFNPVSITGTPGRQYLSSGITSAQLDKALDFDKDELLSDIPE